MVETPARRRSTRNASRAGASPTPAPAETPAARRASRGPKAATPLPQVQTAGNQSYGAAGKVDIDSQMASQDNAFAAVFNTNTVTTTTTATRAVTESQAGNHTAGDGIAVSAGRRSRQNSVAPSSAISGRARGRPSTAAKPPASIAEEVESDEEEEDDELQDDNAYRRIVNRTFSSQEPTSHHNGSVRPGRAATNISFSQTDFPSTFSYFAPKDGGPISGTPAPRFRQSSIARAVRPPATFEEIQAARPWFARITAETIPRWVDSLSPYFVLRNVLFALGLALLVFLASGANYNTLISTTSSALRQLQAMPQAVVDSIVLQAEKARNSAVHGTAYDKNLFGRVSAIEKDLDFLRQSNTIYRESIDELKSILPNNLIVQKNKETGRWELPTDFWPALKEKISSDHDLSVGKATVPAPSWDAFLKHNKNLILKTIAQESRDAAHGTYDESRRAGHIISQEQFLEAIEENNVKLNKRLSTFESSVTRRTEQIAQDAAKAAISRRRSEAAGFHYLEDLALLNMARNHDLLMKSVNYFSAALGAVVNPHLTSPTYQKGQPNLLATAWSYLPFSSVPSAHPAVAALEGWDETGDCWCAAASSDRGKAQLGVIMPRSIIPTSFTVEHMPSQGTFDIGAAPQELEMWVKAPEFDGSEDKVAALPPCSGTPPALDYVCIGQGRYDVHGTNHVQNFPLYSGVDVGRVNEAVVRVVSNWGRPWTCLYRVRMHGKGEDELGGEQKA